MPRSRSTGRLAARLATAGVVLLGVVVGVQAPAAAIAIDGYDFDAPKGGTCYNGYVPGLGRLIPWLEENGWGARYSTYCDPTSTHHNGRAVDWFLNVNNAEQRARAEALIYTLLAPDAEGNAHSLARRMGIQEIIYNDLAWDARLGDGGMVPYGVGQSWQNCGNVSGQLYTDMHCDHIHIGVNEEGGNEQTTFWNRNHTQRSDATMVLVNDGSTAVVGRPIFGRPADARLGLPGDKPVVGDWDGTGDETPGMVRGNVWHLRNSISTGAANLVFGYGLASDTPVAGDWDGNGTETPGVFRNENGRGVFYLRNSNSDGVADIRVEWGLPTDLPVAGDWDGDGRDTVGVYRAGEGRWYFKLNNTTGNFANINYAYGLSTDKPVVGDWDGDGRDTAGVLRAESGQARWWLKNTNDPNSLASQNFLVLPASGRPIAGDWNRNGKDSVGVAVRY